MAREPAVAAGGIVLRREPTPRIAVVRLRKRNEWVLPKGRLDDGETARAAAQREVREETGHDVSVHEFLGTLVYQSGGRARVVHYWRMESWGEQVHELMDDIRAVDWLPLEAAVERLSRVHEQAFLANVGPLALEASALERLSRGSTARKPPAPEKRRRKPALPPVPAVAPADEPWLVADEARAAGPAVAAPALTAPPPSRGTEAVEAEISEAEIVEAEVAATPSGNAAIAAAVRVPRTNLVQKVRDWLRRAA